MRIKKFIHLLTWLPLLMGGIVIGLLYFASYIEDILVAERGQFNQIITALILFLISVITLVLWRWGRSTLQRIEQLRYAAEIISTGDFKHLINDTEKDELGDFSRAMDSMMQKLNQIEEHVNQRTDELENANQRLNETLAHLEKTKIAAENANHAKSVFLANMSHELRTPLNAILGFAQLIARNKSVPDEVQSDVQTIIRCGQQLLSLISDVLEISSIETGHLKIELETIHLPNLLATFADSVLLPNRNVLFRFEPAPDLPEYIHSDFGKLRQMLHNLVSNAIKFTSQGVITLQAYTHFQAAQLTLCITVNDTGIGISESDLSSLFKPFFQSEYGMNLGKGTGLGLYIAQEYANLLGGEITVKSTPNKGSTFLITLPITLATENEPIVKNHKGDILNLAAGQPTFRILVVDDQPENQHLISELLKQVGFQVCIAANGQQAVQCFQKWKPHFVYMDVRMPEMDGSEATRIIRAMSGGKQIPIVALTASVIDTEHPDILEAGCNAILKKPVEPNVLFETIGRYLNAEFEYGTHRKFAEKDFKMVDLSVLPDDIRQRLRTAAISLDTEIINAIADELMHDYSDCALYLQQLADEFQFDFISTLTTSAIEN
jgi:signal transduction histidine kinase/DNA-binding response OmpR family regulator